MIGSNGRPVVDLKKLCCVIALGAMAPFAFAQDKFDRELAFVRGRQCDLRTKQTELAAKYREKYRQLGITR